MSKITAFFSRHADKVKHVLKSYQEIVFWLPPAIALVFITRWLFPQLDPTSGIDGLGQLNAMIVNLVGGIIICFSSWLTKRTYDRVLTPGQVVELLDWGTPTPLVLAARVIDVGVWTLCFYFWFQVVF